jgi:acetate---CoA ligase (ADP-forming)
VLAPDRRSGSIRCLYDPASVAVVGASRHPRKWGYRLALSMLDGAERRSVYLVNTGGGEILGQRAFRCLDELPEVPEMVAVAVPAGQFDTVVSQSLELGVRAIVGITAGLGEKGGGAQAREHALARRVRETGAVMVGPNCAGLADAQSGLRLEFSQRPTGTVGFVSQSGNLVHELGQLMEPLGLGFSRYVTVGNQADLACADFLDHMVTHEPTEIILCYVEEFTDGGEFIRAARRAADAGKRLAVLAGGRSHAGARSALSHTGSLVSDRRVVAAACRAAGAALVATPSELADLAQAWAAGRTGRGRRVAILGDGGGPCGIAADTMSDLRLEIRPFSSALSARLAAQLPHAASTGNPVDLAGAPESGLRVYLQVLATLLDADEVDAVLLTGFFGGYSAFGAAERREEVAVAEAMAAAIVRSGKPTVVQAMHPSLPAMSVLRAAKIPVFGRIESAARALDAICADPVPVAVPGPAPAPDSGEHPPPHVDGYWAARATMAAAGIPMPLAERAESRADALSAAESVGYPVVLKSLGAVHKSDRGGVVTGLPDREALAAACDDLRLRLGATEFSVEAMAPVGSGIEMIAGVRRDEKFGLAVMIGLGGVLAEVLDDVSVALAPVTGEQVAQSIRRLRAAPLLAEWRGRPALDVAGLIEAVLRLVDLASSRPEVMELEINPLLVLPDRVLALDARVITATGPGGENGRTPPRAPGTWPPTKPEQSHERPARPPL